jgi:uncharacterized protein
MYVHQIQRPALYLIISVCSLFYNSLAQASSFNCLSPNLKKFEEMICTNTTLSILDERVNSYYEDALKLPFKPPAELNELKKIQKIIMARRKNCKTVDCLQSIYETGIESLKSAMKNHLPFDPSKPAYPVWISPLLTDPELTSACNGWENSEIDQELDNIACKGPAIMRKAKPAYQSAVKDFVFTEKSVDVLPNILRIWTEGGNGPRCRNYMLNRFRIPISQSSDYKVSSSNGTVTKTKRDDEWRIKSHVIDNNQLTLDFQFHHAQKKIIKPKEPYDYQLNLKIVGRGDLLGTGWENLLVQITTKYPPKEAYNFPHHINFFILTRKLPTETFQVSNAEKTLAYGFICAELPAQARE